MNDVSSRSHSIFTIFLGAYKHVLCCIGSHDTLSICAFMILCLLIQIFAILILRLTAPFCHCFHSGLQSSDGRRTRAERPNARRACAMTTTKRWVWLTSSTTSAPSSISSTWRDLNERIGLATLVIGSKVSRWIVTAQLASRHVEIHFYFLSHCNHCKPRPPFSCKYCTLVSRNYSPPAFYKASFVLLIL